MKTSLAIHFHAARADITPAIDAAWAPQQPMGIDATRATRVLTASPVNGDNGEIHALDARSLR